jgi:hypothetical protein
MRVWRCKHCGTTQPGPSIDLPNVRCRCGVGSGLWAVADGGQHEPDDAHALAMRLAYSDWTVDEAAEMIRAVATRRNRT